MPKRVSHSLLDPWLTAPLKGLYSALPIPAALPPEAIVACGHVAAIAGAVGLAYSSRSVWGGVLGAMGVALNHMCDVLDGAHARATGQCRNGGELLDHFVDPLSFSYWAAGAAAAASSFTGWAPWLGMLGIVVIYATAVLTNISAKMTGEFTLARFGPTELKTLLTLFAVSEAIVIANSPAERGMMLACGGAFWFLAAVTAAGLAQLIASLIRSVREVNALGAAPADTTEWHLENV